MSHSPRDSAGTPAVRLWKIKDEKLVEVEKPVLDLEERLENWIASDISIIASNLLVIGRQVETDYGGVIDLLCIDENGDLVIIELKRDKTPREITAQVLDYASWVKHLSPERVQSIANEFIKEMNFEQAFQNKFNQDLPESINEEHRMLVVGSQIDSSSRRIINYLTETFGLPINAVTFNYFNEGTDEYLARTFLIEQSKTTITIGSKRRPNLTYEQLQQIANERGVGDIYNYLFSELQVYFDGVNRTRSSIAFVGRFREIRRATIFNLIPLEGDLEKSLCWQVYDLRFREYFNLNVEDARMIYPKNREPWKYGAPGDQTSYEQQGIQDEWAGFTGFMNMDEARAFVKSLSELSLKRSNL